jgi:hypothetical protein
MTAVLDRHFMLRIALAALFLATMSAGWCEAAVRVEAYRGQPFGVGRVTVDLPQDVSTDDDRFALTAADGRVLYPVIEHRQIGRIVRRFINIELPNRATFYFLFLGNDPLRLTLHGPQPLEFDVQPEADREEYDELLEDWWDAVGDRYEKVHRNAAYPLVVENYLVANWARRLNVDMPDPGLALLGQRRIGGSWVAQLAANEAYQSQIERDLVLGRFGAEQTAEVPLPASPFAVSNSPPRPRGGARGGESSELPAPPTAEVEPLATRVPQECFYLRFGSFTNYLWYRDFFRHWKNDLGNMIVLRSINRETRDRLQSQLAIGESELARVMGPQVIHDVAFIGFDNYLRDGASFGILFQANNSFLLGRNFNGQRDEAAAHHKDAKLETIQIAGHDVSFLSTPDGKLRSYYATEGDFHLITTSRRMVERFLEVAAANGSDSIGSLAEFQQTRGEFPLSRDDTVFLYLSRPFFANLAGPAYRTELDRRLRSIGEMRVLEIAKMAAAAEDSSARSVDQLIADDLLPRGFGSRADGSQLIADGTGYRDSLRGTPGWFLPIADMPIENMTRAEAGHYAEFVRSIDAEVGQFVPVVAAVKMQPSDDGALDLIHLDVRVSPYSETRMVKWARMLGPAEPLRVAPIEGDVASLELSIDALGQPLRLFGGLRDFHTPLVVREGEARPEAATEEYVRGYVGTWPRPWTLIERFIGRPTGPPDADGIVRNDGLFNLYQQRRDDFFVLAFKRDVLAEVGPQLALVEAEQPAQIRLWIDDLHDKQIATGVNGYGYSRARGASAAATRFMNSLTTQLHVPPEHARDVAEQLVGGHFECPLGGTYELVESGERSVSRDAQRSAPADEKLPTPGARRLWASTAVVPENRFLLTEIPADYEMPFMEWFRGLSLEVTRDDAADALKLHAGLAMVHQDVTPPAETTGGGLKLPSLGGLFGGWGASKAAEATPPAEAVETMPTPPPVGSP